MTSGSIVQPVKALRQFIRTKKKIQLRIRLKASQSKKLATEKKGEQKKRYNDRKRSEEIENRRSHD